MTINSIKFSKIPRHVGVIKLFLACMVLFLFYVVLYFFVSPPKIIMSYYVPEKRQTLLAYDEGANKQLSDQMAHLDVIAYAFLRVNTDGNIIFNENDLDVSLKNMHFCKQGAVVCNLSSIPSILRGDFDFFSALPNTTHVKKIISFGGADDKQSFFNAINHADRFVDSVSATLNQYELAGLDLDFEINRLYTPAEAKAYAALVRKLRTKLGPNKLISMATIIDKETLQSMGGTNWEQIADNADLVSLMCYDLTSPFSPGAYTQFASNLYEVKKAPQFLLNTKQSCDQSIKHLIRLGVPASKIMLGIPAYAVTYGGVAPKNNGLFQPADPAQTPGFDDMGKGLLRYTTVLKLNKRGFQEHSFMTNSAVNGVWSYNPATHQFRSYDNPQSAHDKATYVKKNNLAGIMMWRIGQDMPIESQASLLKSIVDSIHLVKKP